MDLLKKKKKNSWNKEKSRDFDVKEETTKAKKMIDETKSLEEQDNARKPNFQSNVSIV